MDVDHVARAIRAHLVEDLFFGDPSVSVDGDTDLFELGLDSLGINRLVVFIERTLDVTIPDEAVVQENFRTIDALVALVSGLR